MLKKNGPGQCCCGGECEKINTWDNISVDAEIIVTETLPQSVLNDTWINPFVCESRHDVWCGDSSTVIPSPDVTIELDCGVSWQYGVWTLWDFAKHETADTYKAYWGKYHYDFDCGNAKLLKFCGLIELELASDPSKRYMIGELRWGHESDVVIGDDSTPVYRCIDGELIAYKTYLFGIYRSEPYTYGADTSITLDRYYPDFETVGNDTVFRWGNGTLPETMTAYTL